MSDEVRNLQPQQAQEFSIAVVDRGKIRIKVIDRISVDDVAIHLTNQRIYNIITGDNMDYSIPDNFKDFLVRERFRVR